MRRPELVRLPDQGTEIERGTEFCRCVREGEESRCVLSERAEIAGS